MHLHKCLILWNSCSCILFNFLIIYTPEGFLSGDSFVGHFFDGGKVKPRNKSEQRALKELVHFNADDSQRIGNKSLILSATTTQRDDEGTQQHQCTAVTHSWRCNAPSGSSESWKYNTKRALLWESTWCTNSHLQRRRREVAPETHLWSKITPPTLRHCRQIGDGSAESITPAELQ